MTVAPARIAFYVSGHGYGHASRQIEIINSLADGTQILIRTTAPRWLFERTLHLPFTIDDTSCDTGIVQIDSLRLDEEETVRRAGAFYATFDERAANEAAFLHQHQVDLVVSDAPPLACAAAEIAGRRSIVISNFTWEWIYSAYREQFEAVAPNVIPTIRQAYSTAAEGWRLPMHGGFTDIQRVSDLPWVARHSKVEAHETLRRLGIADDKPRVLSSFGGYGVRDLDLRSLDCLDAWKVIVTGRQRPEALPSGVTFVDEDAMYSAGLRYEDLVAACDVVASKPGYGIISECIANDTALLYTSRGKFLEYDVMVREMPRVLRCAYIDQERLLAGTWRASLDGLLIAPPPPERPATNGARIAAHLLGGFREAS